MITRNRIRAEKSVRAFQAQTREQYVAARVGDGNNVIDDSRRGNHVFVRIHGSDSYVLSVENQSPSVLRYDTPVTLKLVQQDAESHYVIVSVADWVEYEYASSELNPHNFTRPHAEQHVRRDGGTGGEDPLDVYARMMVPLRARAQDTPDLTVRVEAGYNPLTGNYVAEQDSVAFTPPSGSGGGFGNARWDLLYLDDADALQILQGTVAPTSPTKPTIPENCVPLAYVYLTNATTAVDEDVIYDARLVPSARFDTSVALQTATQVGQVLFSVDGSTFVSALPVTDAAAGWLVDGATGLLLVTA